MDGNLCAVVASVVYSLCNTEVSKSSVEVQELLDLKD